METDTKTIEIINKTLSNRNYDSTYNVIFDVRCAYFFYETSDNRKRLIVFGKGGDIPYELIDLQQYLEKLWYPTDHLTVSTPFLVDSMVMDFEKELFFKYPPGPRQIFKEWSEN